MTGGRCAATVAVLGVALALGSGASGAPSPPVGCDPPTGGRTVLVASARSGSLDPAFPDLPLTAAVSDGHGGWYAVGRLACVGRRGEVAHVLGGGRIDRTWTIATRPGQPSPATLVRRGGTLLVASPFAVSAIDVTSPGVRWTASLRQRRPDDPGAVALAASSDTVWVGGGFDRVAGVPRTALAALDLRSGAVLPWTPPRLDSGDPRVLPYVGALALGAGRLFVGGTFSRIGGVDLVSIAALDPRTGKVTSWRANPPRGVGDVERIVVGHGLVCTAGHDGFGITDARTGRTPSWVRRLGLRGSSFAVQGTTLYVGGDLRNGFTRIGGLPRRNLAAIDLVHARVSGWDPRLDYRYVSARPVPSGSRVLLLGSFTDTIG